MLVECAYHHAIYERDECPITGCNCRKYTDKAGLQQMLATSALVSFCERITTAGLLSVEESGQLTVLLYKVRRAFNLPMAREP